MLTKEERAAIAERANRAKYNMDSIFEILHGYSSPEYMSLKDDFIAMVARVLELCDTSNMLELPVDKDGEVICPGDTVYVDDDVKYKVVGYMMRGNGTEVILAAGAEPVYTKEPANNITHKEPITIDSIVARIRNVLKNDYSEMSSYTSHELVHIANDLESLGDSDD